MAIADLARAFAADGDLDSAVLTAYRALALQPLRESTHRLLVELHVAAGDYGEALRRYRCSRVLLAAELGVRPSPRMVALVRGIPRQRSSAVLLGGGGAAPAWESRSPVAT